MGKTLSERFVKVYTQGVANVIEIWVDRATGVNYLFHYSGYTSGLCPLLDENGKPVITQINETGGFFE